LAGAGEDARTVPAPHDRRPADRTLTGTAVDFRYIWSCATPAPPPARTQLWGSRAAGQNPRPARPWPHRPRWNRTVSMETTIPRVLPTHPVTRSPTANDHDCRMEDVRVVCSLPGTYTYHESQPRREFRILPKGRVEIRKGLRGRTRTL